MFEISPIPFYLKIRRGCREYRMVYGTTPSITGHSRNVPVVLLVPDVLELRCSHVQAMVSPLETELRLLLSRRCFRFPGHLLG